VNAEINASLRPTSVFRGDGTLKARTDPESTALDVAMNHLGAAEIQSEVNKALGQSTMGY
jgi:hypothetical protein